MNYKTDFTTEELLHALDAGQFRTTPRHHQLVTLAWSIGEQVARPSWWHGIGTGKSLAALYMNQLWGSERTLIVCPNSVLDGWEDQIAEHTDLPLTVLRGSKKARRELLTKTDTPLYAVNYEGLSVLFAESVEIVNPKSRSKTRKEIAYEWIKKARLDSVIFDECHLLKTKEAARSKIAHAVSQAAQHAITMTGSPVSLGEEDIWSEYFVLDDGQTLGRSFDEFMRLYFDRSRVGGSGKYWWVQSLKKGARERILQRIAPITLRYSREECLDLPPTTYQTRLVDMTKEQRDAYDVILATKDPFTRGHALAEIAGGFIIEDGVTRRLRKNPKLDELATLAGEIEGKAIVFHQYVEEGRQIAELFKKQGIQFAELRAEVKDKSEAKRRFQQDPSCQWLIAHPSCGGVGLNFQMASVAVFFSNSYDGAIEREQAEGRIDRSGQTKTCVFIDLCVRDSVDERKLAVCHERSTMADVILDFVKKWKC